MICLQTLFISPFSTKSLSKTQKWFSEDIKNFQSYFPLFILFLSFLALTLSTIYRNDSSNSISLLKQRTAISTAVTWQETYLKQKRKKCILSEHNLVTYTEKMQDVRIQYKWQNLTENKCTIWSPFSQKLDIQLFRRKHICNVMCG